MHVTVRPTNRDPARGLLAAACLLAVACTGDGGGPAGPSPVSPGTTSSVSVTHPADHGTIYIGDQVQFQATVSSSGGATQAATSAVWASDAPAVATGAHSRFPGHALTPTGVMAIRCKQFHLPDL